MQRGIQQRRKRKQKIHPGRKRVFIVEDHPVFREGLKQMIGHDRGLMVCGEAADFTSAFKNIRRLTPDLALVDITLPDGNGLRLIRRLRTSNRKIKLLVVSMHDEAVYANRVLRAGGDGYIMKQEDPDEILHAIHDVLEGHIYVSEDVLNGSKKTDRGTAGANAALLAHLTDRELEILECLGQGKGHAEIARITGSRPHAITTARSEIRKKLGLPSAQVLLRFAVCWVESDSR